MSTLTALRDVEIERRGPRKILRGHWLGIFPSYSDDEIRRRAAEQYYWDRIELQRWPSIVLIRPDGHE